MKSGEWTRHVSLEAIAGQSRLDPDQELLERQKVFNMTKWEYATIPLLIHNTKGILDTWGDDGWELVQVIPGPSNPETLVAYLKRPKE